MNTANIKFIGIKEFRQHMAEFAKAARDKKQRIIVMNRNQPLFEVKPFMADNNLSSLVADIAAARADVAAGRVYSQEEIMAELE